MHELDKKEFEIVYKNVKFLGQMDFFFLFV